MNYVTVACSVTVFHNIADCTAALYYSCTEETAMIKCLVPSFVSAD